MPEPRTAATYSSTEPETVIELECVGDSSVIHERGEWDDCRECFPAESTTRSKEITHEHGG